jgi:hypothetical protein
MGSFPVGPRAQAKSKRPQSRTQVDAEVASGGVSAGDLVATPEAPEDRLVRAADDRQSGVSVELFQVRSSERQRHQGCWFFHNLAEVPLKPSVTKSCSPLGSVQVWERFDWGSVRTKPKVDPVGSPRERRDDGDFRSSGTNASNGPNERNECLIGQCYAELFAPPPGIGGRPIPTTPMPR